MQKTTSVVAALMCLALSLYTSEGKEPYIKQTINAIRCLKRAVNARCAVNAIRCLKRERKRIPHSEREIWGCF